MMDVVRGTLEVIIRSGRWSMNLGAIPLLWPCRLDDGRIVLMIDDMRLADNTTNKKVWVVPLVPLHHMSSRELVMSDKLDRVPLSSLEADYHVLARQNLPQHFFVSFSFFHRWFEKKTNTIHPIPPPLLTCLQQLFESRLEWMIPDRRLPPLFVDKDNVDPHRFHRILWGDFQERVALYQNYHAITIPSLLQTANNSEIRLFSPCRIESGPNGPDDDSTSETDDGQQHYRYAILTNVHPNRVTQHVSVLWFYQDMTDDERQQFNCHDPRELFLTNWTQQVHSSRVFPAPNVVFTLDHTSNMFCSRLAVMVPNIEYPPAALRCVDVVKMPPSILDKLSNFLDE
eukprot:GILJ01017410.1.p1 GENE.GILJ01017410.1~~GILJ01017410.1.p1  ORF type:complete len:383 (-),score=30.69 GILJ01017410.1:27-1052(-)